MKKVYSGRDSATCEVSLCENRQQQSCKAFIGLSIRAKMGDVRFCAKLWLKLTHPLPNCQFLIDFRLWYLSHKT